MSAAVSVVIPTTGRPTLMRAVRSALAQSVPVTEVIVVADGNAAVTLPDDDRIRLLSNGSQGGAARCRQVGIDAARGAVIALLDDDDEWVDTKLERQLAGVRSGPGVHWIASSRICVHGPGSRRRVWPRHLIEPGQMITDYLYRVGSVRRGEAVLQTSTLCFPTDLAHRVRWDRHADAVHDESSWLIAVQREIPDLQVWQSADVLSIYDVGAQSVSRDPRDRVDEYIEWGLEYLGSESARVRGDYLCSSPVSAAVSAGVLSGVLRSVRAALRHGRPGPIALGYAGLSAVRIVLRKSVTAFRR